MNGAEAAGFLHFGFGHDWNIVAARRVSLLKLLEKTRYSMASQPDTYQFRRSQFLTDSFQRGLAHWNRERLQPGFPAADWQKRLERDLRMTRLEGGFLEELRAEIIDEAARAPTDPDGFVVWFEELKRTGPGQGDPLFPWLAGIET